MPKPILFSLPVHERPNIVKRQLANIRRFAPNALVCIHVSQSASREEFARLAQPGVLINSLSLPTVMHCGLMHVHVANFAYAVLCKETFGRMVFISSNELFIRSGVEDYINAHILGTQIEMLDPTADWQLFERGVEKDSRMAGLMKELNIPIFFGGQAEGQFYDFHLFAEICRLYGILAILSASRPKNAFPKLSLLC